MDLCHLLYEFQFWYTEEFYWTLWQIENNTNKIRSSEVIDLSLSNTVIFPNDYNMQFGVLITDFSGKPVQYDPTYFTIKMIENTSHGHGYFKQ